MGGGVLATRGLWDGEAGKAFFAWSLEHMAMQLLCV